MPEATDGEADKDDADNGVILPIAPETEKSVVDMPEATDGEADEDDADNSSDAADDAPDADDEPTDSEPKETAITVVVLVDAPEGDNVPEGAPVWMTAVVTGAEPDTLLYQWQYSSDGEEWTDIDGANGQTYEAVMTAANAGGYWRVTVSTVENEQGDEEA